MKNITKEFIQKFLSQNKVELCSTQGKLCIPIIDRIYRKMVLEISFSGIKVDDDLICDGHHRYFASLLANRDIERIPSTRTSATIRVEWELVVFVDEDWDTAAKINMLDEQDAKFNNITTAELAELLK